MTVEVRQAREEDVPALAATLASAFADYPWTRWLVDPDDHPRRLRELYGVYLELAVRFGQVWMAADASGAAAWTWSGDDERRDAHMAAAGLDVRVGELLGARGEAAGRAQRLLEPHALAEPHWYLAAVGVAPECQRQGLGARLLAPVLRACDERREVAALETSSAGNLRLYRRLGFAVRAEVDVPDGPHVWLMRRAPA